MSTSRLRRRFAQAGAVLTAAGVAVLLSGGPAAAHVSARVIGEPAQQGGFTKITFRVPNEDDTAGTVKLEIKFSTEHPIASLRTKPMPGWTAVVTKAKLDKPIEMHGAEVSEAVSTIVWTASPGTRIGPGEFAEFEVSGGPLPANTDMLVMPAAQTYENGKVVSWNEPPPAEGATEPEHPAPVIAIAPEAAENGAAAQANSGSGGSANTAGSESTATASSSDSTARWLGGAGLVVGALGLGVGFGATLRARRAIATAKAGEGS